MFSDVLFHALRRGRQGDQRHAVVQRRVIRGVGAKTRAGGRNIRAARKSCDRDNEIRRLGEGLCRLTRGVCRAEFGFAGQNCALRSRKDEFNLAESRKAFNLPADEVGNLA